MANLSRPKFGKPNAAMAIAFLAVAGTTWFAIDKRRPPEAAADNYRLVFGLPEGWKSIPHGPSTLFLFREPHTNLLIRGGMNVLEDEINPTPDLDTDALARQYIQTTQENMPTWQGKLLDVVDGNGARFRLVRRWSPDKCVVSAFCVKGNTTVAITLSGNGNEAERIDAVIPTFRSFLTTLALVPEEYGRSKTP